MSVACFLAFPPLEYISQGQHNFFCVCVRARSGGGGSPFLLQNDTLVNAQFEIRRVYPAEVI